jgi:hypothetical protein
LPVAVDVSLSWHGGSWYQSLESIGEGGLEINIERGEIFSWRAHRKGSKCENITPFAFFWFCQKVTCLSEIVFDSVVFCFYKYVMPFLTEVLR